MSDQPQLAGGRCPATLTILMAIGQAPIGRDPSRLMGIKGTSPTTVATKATPTDVVLEELVIPPSESVTGLY